MLKTWKHVTREAPCPICGKPDWCIVSADGDACVCYRVESQKASRGGGWLHVLRERPRDLPPPRRRAASPPPPQRTFDAAAYHARLRETWDHVWLDGLAMSIGASMEALERLEPAWDARHQAFAFPMRDGDGRVVGIRLRSHEGRKWAVSGSKSGLFHPASFELGEDRDIVVLEGPTDTAAALTIGLPAVGRPSCNSGEEDLKRLIARLGVRQVTIIADHDEAKSRPNDAGYWRPGTLGAVKLAQGLKRMYRIVTPPDKDFRQWATNSQLDRAAYEAYAKNSRWRLP
jgi:hypothetical protein